MVKRPGEQSLEGLDEDAVEWAIEEQGHARRESVRQARALREGIRERMVELERAIAAPAGADGAAWWDRVLECLGALRDAFQRHVAATEAPGGIHDEIVAYAPRLAHARDRLVHAHVEIATALDLLTAPAPPPGGVSEAREAVLDVLGQLARHRHRGADFVYEAYNFDIGGGD